MSDLYKQALKKGKPPKPEDEEDDDSNEEEELKDQMEYNDNKPTNQQQEQQPQSFQGFGSGPIKPTQSFSDKPPAQSGGVALSAPGQKKLVVDYSPKSWEEFYDEKYFTENGTPVYKAGTDNPIFFCLHGAGDSALSFACLAKEIKKFASLVSFDYRGHGDSKVHESKDDLSIDTLIKDTEMVLRNVCEKYPEPNIIIVGHSMGGSVASKFTDYIMQFKEIAVRIQGLIVIDVVEGTAIDALPFMESIVNNRPKQFKTMEDLIKWSIRTSTLRNLGSARVSMPPKVKLVEEPEKNEVHYEWKVDLLKSQEHWLGWFKGLTQQFLNVRIPKLLMTAEKERLDKDLTIAQMQGKFKLVVLYDTGHYMQEDDFVGTAKQFYSFLNMFRIPLSVSESQELQTVGVGKFHPKIKQYN